jgi:hypothetical protein
MNLIEQYHFSMDEGIVPGWPASAAPSIRRRLRRRCQKRLLWTLAMWLGVVLGAVWTIVFGVGLLFP